MKSAMEKVRKIEEILNSGSGITVDVDIKWREIKEMRDALQEEILQGIRINTITNEFLKNFLPCLEDFEELVEDDEGGEKSRWYYEEEGAYECLYAIKRFILPQEIAGETPVEKGETLLANLLDLLKNQGHGEKGVLRVDGNPNRFIVRSRLRKKEVHVLAQWTAEGWLIDAII